jgi:alkyl hydroperoxide reductase subunit AhpF
VPLLKPRDRESLQNEFQKLVNPIKLLFFTQGLDCETCPITKQIVEEVASLDPRISVQEVNRVLDKDTVEKYGIKRIPAIVPVRLETVETNGESATVERDYGIRFYGVPSGYEFVSFVGDILDLSRGDSALAPDTREALKQLTEPLHLQVFTTPT